ncbi:2-hydroxyacid dehydrogenase [Mycolicibacterium mengxianglii]|uniref:2-hydroxyacid dehydrogenase n=1 Tax=Mycolicibacterium mengxianglii TaxID=2736649 RepID=UPI0018D0C682|nr:2-hydroxyacid dehydrogenase [Mycolicibacterium mengxianglii]
MTRSAERTTSAVLQVGPLKPSLQDTLRTSYDALVLPTDPEQSAAFLAEHGERVTVAVTSGGAAFDAALMARLPHLEAIVNFGVGYDTIDVAAAAQRGITVSNTPDVLTDSVADTAVGLMIDTLRRFSAADRFVREGSWPKGSYPLTRDVSNTAVGIVGMGRIGRAIAARLTAFGCRISYHNRKPVPDSDFTYVESPQELAGGVDVLVVAAAGGPGTRGLVDAKTIAALGPEGYLINISRGSVVDEDALVDALVNGRLAGAGLDVFANEPHVPQALLGLDNVVLLPHVSSATVQTRAAMEELTLRNLESFLATGDLVTPIAMPSR